MIIITLYWLFIASSIRGILTDAARFGGARNLERFRRSSFPEYEVNDYLFTDDPLSHHLFNDHNNQDLITRFDNGSMILRGVLYDKDCLPPLGEQLIGSVYPRFEDCRTYLVQISQDSLLERSCPKNGIFDPSSSSCVVFKNSLVPANCHLDCPGYGEPVYFADSLPHFYCDQYNPDGSERPIDSENCIPVSARQANARNDRMLDSLTTGYPEGSSSEFGSDVYKKDSPEMNLRLEKRHTKGQFEKAQIKEKVISMSASSKLPISKRKSKDIVLKSTKQANTRSDRMLDSLPTGYPEDSSGEFGPTDYKNYSPELNLLRKKRHLEDKPERLQRNRVKSTSVTYKLPTSRRNYETLKSDSLPKLTFTRQKRNVESIYDEVSEQRREEKMKNSKRSGRSSNSYVEGMEMVSDDGSLLELKKKRVSTDPIKLVGRNYPKYVNEKMSDDVSNDATKSRVHYYNDEPLRYSRHNYLGEEYSYAPEDASVTAEDLYD